VRQEWQRIGGIPHAAAHSETRKYFLLKTLLRPSLGGVLGKDRQIVVDLPHVSDSDFCCAHHAKRALLLCDITVKVLFPEKTDVTIHARSLSRSWLTFRMGCERRLTRRLSIIFFIQS
jgi:hypothetical protein